MTEASQQQPVTDFLLFTSEEEYESYKKANADRVILRYKNGIYDVSDFVESHPGGDDIVKDCNGREITELFHSSYPHAHSKSALRMMLKYKVAEVKTELSDSTDADTPNESFPVITADYIQYKDFRMNRKEGFIFQTLSLSKEQYLEFIHHALHLDYTRLFSWSFFEFFTRNKWWYIPLGWAPVILYFLISAMTGDYGSDSSQFDKYIKLDSPDFSQGFVIFAFLAGMLNWTLSEYTLHRFLFHMAESFLEFRWVRWFHFMIHGIHHVIPTDPDRLVFPPVLAYVISILIFYPLNFIWGGNLSRFLYAATMTMYVLYEYFHWWLHHGKGGLSYSTDMKRYHNLHHFFDADQGYGITTKLWDHVFGTVIEMKETKISK